MNDECNDLDGLPEAVQDREDMRSAWEAQRDANLAVQQVDKLEGEKAALEARVLVLTNALTSVRRTTEKQTMAPVWMKSAVLDIVKQAGV